MANQGSSAKMPPLQNWNGQTFAYGFLVMRSTSNDYTGDTAQPVNIADVDPADIHLLNLNPQSISVDEPIATEVSAGMDAGKVIESRGWITKPMSIRGHTGFLPPIAPYATHMKSFQPVGSSQVDAQAVQQATGFYEFYHLRNLFRQFMEDRKAGKIILMHWLDFKADEYWIIEPKRFRLDRGRFSYSYDIGFDCIAPSEDYGTAMQVQSKATFNTTTKGDQALAAALASPLYPNLDPPTSAALARLAQIQTTISTFQSQYAQDVGKISLALQTCVDAIAQINAYYSDIQSLRFATIDTPLATYVALRDAVYGLWNTFDANMPAAFASDINETGIEMQQLSEQLIDHYLRTYGQNPGQAMQDLNTNYTTSLAQQGTADQLMQEPPGSTGSPTVNPFIGSSGLSLIGDLQKMVSTTVFVQQLIQTNETIFDLAQRLLGDGNRFVDLIVFNDLKSPFIVSDPTNKPPGTLAWGEYILVPTAESSQNQTAATPIGEPSQTIGTTVASNSTELYQVAATTDASEPPWIIDQFSGYTITFTSGLNVNQSLIVVSNDDAGNLVLSRNLPHLPQAGDTFTLSLIIFSKTKPLTSDAIAFGVDIAAIFSVYDGLIVDGTVDVMFGPDGDFVTVSGNANFEQAMVLLMQSPVGSDKSNPSYGTPDVVGRPFETNVVALYIFYVRLAMLADPRVQAVLNPTVAFQGGALYFNCQVQPIGLQNTLTFSIPLSR